jgi:hypothetical protein
MLKSKLRLLVSLLVTSVFVGCGGDDDEKTKVVNLGTVYELSPQSGTKSHLFYGETNHRSLGGIKSIKIADGDTPIVLKDELDVRYPVITTAIGEYNATNNSYKDLHANTLSYISGKAPYKVSLKKSDAADEVKNSTAFDTEGTGRRGAFEYTKVNYLGSKQYLLVKDENKTVLITPNMGASDAPIPFEGKEFLTLSFSSYGSLVDGYIVYDANVSGSGDKRVQNCTLDMSCTDIADVNVKPSFIGDVGGTTEAVLLVESKPYLLDKADNNFTKISDIDLPSRNIEISGDSVYFIEDGNISRFDIRSGEVEQISKDSKAERLRAFTDTLVIYGDDKQMHAVKKDGSSAQSIEISVTTKLKGQKQPTSMVEGDNYLYNLYSVNKETGKTTFRACILKGSDKECKRDSFWAAVTAAKDGILNFTSSYPYEAYAYIRVDNTDNYGGGTLKAIDPKHPFENGITLGSVPIYNFQSFIHNSRYANELIDSDGDVIIYGKNDLNFKGDAFLVNLNRANSLKNITNEAPPPMSEINGFRNHCHGRYCSVCHNFAGGKIYADVNGTKDVDATKGYNVKLEFENGSSVMAANVKGMGENFNIPMETIVGKDFTAIVVDGEGNKITRSNEFSHKGAEFFNCNFCHGRRGDLKHDTPNVITVEQTEDNSKFD